jgi:SAM-dependent methyltransferase
MHSALRIWFPRNNGLKISIYQTYTIMKYSRIKDFVFIMSGVILLLPFFYLFNTTQLNWFTTTLYVLIMYPTLAALINGAPFVPTPYEAAEMMIKAANLQKGQKVYDIGCGDGRIVHLATKNHSVQGIGFEISPFVYFLARVRKLFWKSKAKIKFKNFKHQNLSDADVIFCYLLPETLAKLEHKLSRELKKGAKVISYSFPVSPWTEKEKIVQPNKEFCPIWIYEKD